MKTKSVLMGLAGLLLLLVSSANAEMRKWTRTGGTHFVAEFVKSDRAVVTLRKTDGTEFTVKMALLSKEDRKYVMQQPQNVAAPVQAPGAAPHPGASPRPAAAPPCTANIKYKRDVFGNGLGAHVEIDFATVQHHYAFDLTRDIISLSIGEQFALLGKQFHFAEDEALAVKRQLATVKWQVFYHGRTVSIPLD